VQPLSQREREVLWAVVTEFTASGEPVGSQTLARRYGIELSPATIRSVLAALEDRGLLAQPHHSSGRVPTELALRTFIDALMGVRQLSTSDASRIAGWADAAQAGSDLLRGAGRLLSDLTGGAAVLVRTANPDRPLSALRFIPTRPGELLCVVVLADGGVENRFIRVEPPPGDAELERLHRLLAEVVAGRTLAELRDHLEGRLLRDRDELRALDRVGVSLVHAAIDAVRGRPELVIEGESRLLERREFHTAERVRDLVRALGERERLVELLDRVLGADRVQVLLGGDTEQAVGVAVSLVASPYQAAGRAAGALGVIGPPAMDFPSVIPVVRATAEAMSAALSRPLDPPRRPG